MEIGIREITNFDNTPGFWYAVSYFMAALLFIRSNHAVKKGVVKWLGLFSIGVFLMFFMYITTGCYGFGFVMVMIAVFVLIYSLFEFAIEGDFYKKLYYTIRTFMLGELMASVGWQIFYFGMSNKNIKTDLLHQAYGMIPTYILIIFIGYFLEMRHKPRNREIYITGKETLSVGLGMFILYVLSNMSYVVTGTPFTTVYTSELFIIRTVIDLMAVTILYLYHELLQQTAERLEAEAVKNILELQYSQYQISEESMALVNQKYHDLKHQIIALKANIGLENNVEYLDRMLNDIKKYETRYVTGNKVLDTMLSSEAMKCEVRGVKFTCVADGNSISFMDPMDISALFGNALDNAIEGAEQLENEEERLIHLTLDRQKNFVRIHVENRFNGKIRFYHNLPLTNKEDKKIHGYGVKSMKQISEKYGGTLYTEAQDGWFKLSILIPIPE